MFKFEKILSIEEVGELETYDLTVQEDHSFVGNSVILHNSRGPNYQNIVSHGEFSKIIKRQFIAPEGCLYLKSDYNAHEVRNWANISKDETLAKTFRVGNIMRKNLFLETRPDIIREIKKEIKGKGDIHRINYSFFYGKPAEEVTEKERFGVKTVIFGAIYGKSIATLAEDLKCSEEEASALLSTLFEKFKKGGEWIKNTYSQSRENLLVVSPIGRVRHLGSYLCTKSSILSSTERKSCNSIIQGFSSDMGYMGGRIFSEIVFKKFIERGFPLTAYQINAVHDSIEAITKIEHLPIALYLIEHSYSTLVVNRYKQEFNFECLIEPEVESEFGSTMGNTGKFDWLNIRARAEEEIEYQKLEMGSEGYYSTTKVSDILEKLENNIDIIKKAKKYEIERYLNIYKEDEKAIFDYCLIQNDTAFDKMINKLVF